MLVFGCSSDRTTKSSSQNSQSATVSASLSFPDSNIEEKEIAFCDTFAIDSGYNEVTYQLLERARQHYLSALNSQEQGDSVQSTTEFEYAIGILSELGYYPNIENNKDFNDLSRSVIEDYEKYIAKIDSLGPQTSIFALRQKLNEIDDANVSPDQDAPKKVIEVGSVPLIINGHVEKNIKFFQEHGKSHFEHWLYLSGKYFPMMKKIFREEGIPEELVFLSMVESGLNPIAHSWAKAVGLWQFIKGTGKLYGLEGNVWYDERRDFEEATHAAARHLKDLNAEFGDWYLALAAYNSGAGRVSSAIRRGHATDFWKIRPHLPRETRNYVPQYIAVAVMTMDPQSYGFNVEVSDTLAYEYVVVNDCVDLSVLATCAGTTADVLRELNPELLQGCTPPGYKGYKLRVPVGGALHFDEKYAAIPDDQKRDWVVHKVRKGQTLASIAKKYGVSTNLLVEANHLSGSQRLHAGKTIVIPVPSSSKFYTAELEDGSVSRKLQASKKTKTMIPETNGKEKLTYNVKKGDTLGKIAELYDVRVSDVRVWNNIPYGTTIHVGDVLNVWEPKDIAARYGKLDQHSTDEHVSLALGSATGENTKQFSHSSSPSWVKYTVNQGDNLQKIARKFNVEEEDIRKWNGLRSSVIMTGQELEIQVPDTNSVSHRNTTNIAQKDTVKSKKSVSYTVKKGDTLYSIASSFGVSITELRHWNKLRGSKIHVGQELLINS